MIFNIFKSKPKLKEIIPEGFVDIHSHILPAIDDGAKDVHESLELISKMREIGFSKIIATPHTYPGLYNNTNKSIEDSYNKIKKNTSNIYFASEYMIDKSLINKAKNKELLTLNDDHILVENGFQNLGIGFEEILFNIRINGYKVIIAHPERYSYLSKNFNLLYKLKSMGIKFQLNLFSVTDYYGTACTKFCDKLLEKGIIDYVGSDIHSLNQLNIFYERVKIKNINKLSKAINNNDFFK